MLYCFKKGDSANDIVNEICTVYGSSATIITFIRNWFRPGNFDLKDEGRNDFPAITNMDFIKAMLAENPPYSMQKIVVATNFQENDK